jgi:hypothetical protein
LNVLICRLLGRRHIFQYKAHVVPNVWTSDRNGNIFIAVKDKIFLTRPASSNEYKTILSKPDDIIRPLYIDIDIKSHELFVVNNDGKSVYCFQKQMDNVWRESFKSELSSSFPLCRSLYANCSCDNLKMNNAKINCYNWYVKIILYLKYETGKRVRACVFVCLMMLNATFNNISVISWRSILLVEETGENHRPVASHNKLYHHVIF